MTKVYSYIGNTSETYYILKNGKKIMETFTGEDDAIMLVDTLNICNVELEAEGIEIDENDDIYEVMGQCLSNEPEDHAAILEALIKENKTNPDGYLDNLQFDENDEDRCVIVWEKMENSFTIGEFLKYIGYTN